MKVKELLKLLEEDGWCRLELAVAIDNLNIQPNQAW